MPRTKIIVYRHEGYQLIYEYESETVPSTTEIIKTKVEGNPLARVVAKLVKQTEDSETPTVEIEVIFLTQIEVDTFITTKEDQLNRCEISLKYLEEFYNKVGLKQNTYMEVRQALFQDKNYLERIIKQNKEASK